MTKDIRCPYCNDTISPILEYVPGAYSEHRDYKGMECDNYSCLAEWDNRGSATKESQWPL
jgi:hypothetical protein